jgi:hypothetical protein
MQIFVKHPSTGKTIIFDCSVETTLEKFVEWIQDSMGWPPRTYFITRHGKPISYPYDQVKTFKELLIESNDTIHLTGRLSPMYLF